MDKLKAEFEPKDITTIMALFLGWPERKQWWEVIGLCKGMAYFGDFTQEVQLKDI